MWKNVGYAGIIHMATLKNGDLAQNDARGTLTWKNRAKISEKGVKTGTIGFSIKFAIIWWGDMFFSLKNHGEKWVYCVWIRNSPLNYSASYSSLTHWSFLSTVLFHIKIDGFTASHAEVANRAFESEQLFVDRYILHCLHSSTVWFFPIDTNQMILIPKLGQIHWI